MKHKLYLYFTCVFCYATLKALILFSQDRYLFWSILDERWKIDTKAILDGDENLHRDFVGFIFSETNVLCPGDNAVWSKFNDDAVFKPAPEVSVKMLCRTNYGNQQSTMTQLSQLLLL